MKIVVTSNSADLDGPASPVFGRCSTFVFVEPETMSFEAVENPAVGAAGGAGVQAAQCVVERGAQAVLTGNVGPNAFHVFEAANVPVYLVRGGTVRQAVEAYKAGQLPVSGNASAQEHAGMGRSRGMSNCPPAPSTAAVSREEEIAALRQKAGDLRKQMADILERLDQLEKGE
jgi:predicted Fe-Mo cluster-binding NifX family protein